MECSRRWTFIAVLLYVSYKDKALCHNETSGNGVVRESRECPKLSGFSSSTDMFNSLLSVAASNGVLPDMIPVLQGQQVAENFQRSSYLQDMLAKPLSVVPMPTCGMPQEPIIFSSQPIRPTASNQNVLLATPLSCGSNCPSNLIPAIPQTITPPALPSSNCVSQIAQVLPLENYPICAPNVGAVRPTPIVLQPQSQFNEVNPCNFYNQIAEPISLPEVCTNPVSLPVLPTPQILPPINTCSRILETTPSLGSPCLSQPSVFTSDGQPLQINLPTTSIPAPKVTVVSATPSNSPISVPIPFSSDYPVNLPPFQYPPQPPIILEGRSKSSWRNLLPIILVALLSDRGNNDGGGCCCCCSCNSGSGNNIPIPYPIPIPINNPIINGCPYPYSSRNRECLDDADDEEDKKRK